MRPPTHDRVAADRHVGLIAGKQDLLVGAFEVIVLDLQPGMIGDRVVGVADADAERVEEVIVLVNAPAAETSGDPAFGDVSKRVAATMLFCVLSEIVSASPSALSK